MLPNDETGILKENIESVNHITLKSSQNSFSLSFVVSNYIAGKHNTFAYKLKGYHDEWYKQGDISPVVVLQLPAGDYTFLLKAANNDGKWSGEVEALHIRVLPVWYRTWWAFFDFLRCFFIFVGFLLCSVSSGCVRVCRQKSVWSGLTGKKKEEISQMKIRFLCEYLT